jgi:hypothetical protein
MVQVVGDPQKKSVYIKSENGMVYNPFNDDQATKGDLNRPA